MAGPVVLSLFWVRSWPYHDPVLTLYLAALTMAAIWVGSLTFFYSLVKLRGPRTWRIFRIWVYPFLLWILATVALLFVSLVATVGNISYGLAVGPWPAQLYQAEIVERPEDWLPRGEAEEVFLAEYGEVSRRELDTLLAAEGEGPDWLDAARRAFTEQRKNLLFSFDKLDLSGRDLRRADLRDAFLPGVRLPGARLGGADMTGAQMEGVVFSEQVNGEWIAADLAGAPCDQELWNRIQPKPPEIPLVRAALGCTRLANAHLEGAALRGADLSGADLGRANLSGAVLGAANLSGADLFQANLSGADLRKANLSGADLLGADLSGAVLFRANFSGADLSGANLSGANLREANFSGADLSGANISGVDLGFVEGFEGLRLAGAIGEEKTRLPPRWPTPHVVSTCYDMIDESGIEDMAQPWQMDAETFRARYVCSDDNPLSWIVGPLGVPPTEPAQ